MARTLVATRRTNELTGSQWLAANEVAVDVANGNYAVNDGATLVYAHNTGGSSRTLTLVTPGTVSGLTIGDRVYTVPAAGFGMFGPFPLSIYGDELLFDGSHAELKVLVFSVMPAVRV